MDTVVQVQKLPLLPYFWFEPKPCPRMFFANKYVYAGVLIIQGICLLHSFKRGTQSKWLWLIVLLPGIGSLIYIFTEMFSSRDVEHVQSGIGSLFNPGGIQRRLEDNLKFSDTFTNRTQLADYYLKTGQLEKAIALYEDSLTGNFTDNEYVYKQLIVAYSEIGRYEDILPLARKLYRQPDFQRSRVHMLYAIALGYTGNEAVTMLTPPQNSGPSQTSPWCTKQKQNP